MRMLSRVTALDRVVDQLQSAMIAIVFSRLCTAHVADTSAYDLAAAFREFRAIISTSISRVAAAVEQQTSAAHGLIALVLSAEDTMEGRACVTKS